MLDPMFTHFRILCMSRGIDGLLLGVDHDVIPMYSYGKPIRNFVAQQTMIPYSVTKKSSGGLAALTRNHGHL